MFASERIEATTLSEIPDSDALVLGAGQDEV